MGLAVLLGSVLLAQAVSGLLGMAWQSAGSVVSHAVGGAGAISGVLSAEANPQAMIDRLQQSLGNSGDPTQWAANRSAPRLRRWSVRAFAMATYQSQTAAGWSTWLRRGLV